MRNIYLTQFQEEESTYSLEKKDRILSEKLHSEQIEDFTLFSVESGKAGSVTMIEQKERGKSPKLLVDQYYRFPQINTRLAGRYGFRSLNKWEGIVTEIMDDEFSAILTDLLNGGPQEEVTFSLEEVSEQDIPLLKPGAIFYWNIGYETINGQRRKASVIRFKRLPKWSRKDWDQILDKANELQQGLDWE